MRTVYSGGKLQDFEKYLSYYESNKYDFNVRKYGSVKKLQLKDGKTFKFFGHRGEEMPVGMYLCNLVRIDIDNYLKECEISSSRDYATMMFNPKGIACNLGLAGLAIDMNSCYWVTALKLGYITKKTFNKGMEGGEKFKDARLRAIGSLNKHIVVDEYKAGQLIRSYPDKKATEMTQHFWNNILHHVCHELMIPLSQILQEDFVMWLTDCIFFNPKRYKEVMAFFKDKEYVVKQYTVEFLELEDNTMVWKDNKAGKKRKFFLPLDCAEHIKSNRDASNNVVV